MRMLSISRRRSREAALQVLYALDLAPRSEVRAGLEAVEVAFQRTCENFELPEGARAFAKELISGITQRREELDALLAAHSAHWRLSRMATVDRNILRLGAYELVGSDAPTAVVIDEAVELARRFGGEASPGFVNGVLDALASVVRTKTP